MSENIIISKIEIDDKYNIIFMSIKDFPGVDDLIKIVQANVVSHIDKYRTMSQKCESQGYFIDGMINAPWYTYYKTVYLVLCVPKNPGEISTGPQVFSRDNIGLLDNETLQNYFLNSISYAFLCSHNDSMFDIWDVCVDHTVRTVPGIPSHKAGTRMAKGCLNFVDLLIRHYIPETRHYFNPEGIPYSGSMNNNISIPITVELFARKDNIPAIKAYINAGLNDNIEKPEYVTNMPWLLRLGFGELSAGLEYVYLSYTFQYSLTPIRISDTQIKYVLRDKIIKDDYMIDKDTLTAIKEDFIHKIK